MEKSYHCFFLSWIFTLQAQITPDGGTNTQVNSQNGVELIDIAAPNTSGLSNNSYSEFNVSSSGIILNNSGGTSASQLTGGNISGIIAHCNSHVLETISKPYSHKSLKSQVE